MCDDRDLDYGSVINSSQALAEFAGEANAEVAWLFLENAYYWPNPYYTGEPVCNPKFGFYY